MKRFFVWVLTIVIGLCLFFVGVMAASSYFTTEAALPLDEVLFEAEPLTQNGAYWYVPLIGGALDKQFSTKNTLTVQNLGTIDAQRPAITAPSWVNAGTLRLTDAQGACVFDGDLTQYAAFSYPMNGEYRAELYLWHLPKGQSAAAYAAAGDGAFRRNSGLELPAKPSGWYRYAFKFNLAASPELTLSSEKAYNGDVICLKIDGTYGEQAPLIETDLGDVQAMFDGDSWRAYIPVTYNAQSGAHGITVQADGVQYQTSVQVAARGFATTAFAPEDVDTTVDMSAANSEFRNKIWALYGAPVTNKQWFGAWSCPVTNYQITLDYGAHKYVGEENKGQSNSVVFATGVGDAVVAPAGGTVVLEDHLLLTGNTIVIDHGYGVRTYLYGLSKCLVSEGTQVLQNQTIGLASEEVTVDVKIGNKSISPWNAFYGKGGLFWNDYV